MLLTATSTYQPYSCYDISSWKFCNYSSPPYLCQHHTIFWGRRRVPLYQHRLSLISAWRNYQILNEMWDQIIYPFPNLNGWNVGLWGWISYSIPQVIKLGLKLIHISKMAPMCLRGYLSTPTFFCVGKTVNRCGIQVQSATYQFCIFCICLVSRRFS